MSCPGNDAAFAKRLPCLHAENGVVLQGDM